MPKIYSAQQSALEKDAKYQKVPQNMLLLTYFEPFGEADTNISQQVAERIEAEGVFKLLLPVRFKCSPEVLMEAIEHYQPTFILSLGQCSEGKKIRLERFAMNLMDSEKGDNDGYAPIEETINPNAPLALQTGLNIKHLQTECINAGFPTIISNTAGLYVCNRIYWEALHYTTKALFVHIPQSMNLGIARKTITHLIIQLYQKSL